MLLVLGRGIAGNRRNKMIFADSWIVYRDGVGGDEND